MNPNPAPTRPISILIAGLGGEGGGVLTQWLVELATRAGYPAQSTSIPGVAQRTGATTYYVEVHPQPSSKLEGRRPVLGLAPVPGEVDLFVASELLEAARHVQSGLISPERTLLISSTHRSLTTAERMEPGDGRVDGAHLLDLLQRFSRRCIAFDMNTIAREAGTVPSAVMFGALAAANVLPFARDTWESVVRDSGRGVEASLRGFARAWEAAQTTAPTPTPALSAPESGPSSPSAATRNAPEVDAFPDQVRNLIAAGLERVTDFQDADYGRQYLERLSRIHEIERGIDPDGQHGFALTGETARFLALWMAFDDIVRVARLKCSATRFARVRTEVRAADEDLVHIVDLFKPGIPEIAGLLPASIAAWLKRVDTRRRAAGKPALELALHLRTSSVLGFSALRLIAGLRGLRRKGTRFAEEQRLIQQWLAHIEQCARESWACAHEVALCARLIKGYGATNERGKTNLLHILEHLAAAPFPAGEKASLIRRAREAALADEAGNALDGVLSGSGAPPRPVRPQPVIWHPGTRRRA